MKTPHAINRRRFLAATAGSAFLAVPRIQFAAAMSGENEHFHFRLAPPGDPYIDSQRDHRAFGFTDDDFLHLSEDNGHHWSRRASFPNARNITFSCLLKNGNILFATRTKLYLSTDNLKSIAPVTVRDTNGEEYLPHTPKNPENPGWYFHPLDGVHTWDIGGREILVWGNYCNVRGGAVPVNIFYSTDGGETVRIAYSFGRNPHFQDNGSPGGGPIDGPPLLGNAANPVICRHVHCVAFHAAENAFYACTGDIDRGHGNECHWLRGAYDPAADAWDWKVVVSANSNSRYKSGGINFAGGQIYWVADANGPKPAGEKHDRGIFRCDPADLPDTAKHTLLFNPDYESANMIIEGDTILAAHYATASPYHCGFIVSNDLGKSWAQYDLEGFGDRSGTRIQPKNAEGWFRIDLRKGWIDRGEVLFIKPKS